MEKGCNILTSENPLIFKNILDWQISKWSVEDWKSNLGKSNVKYPFREGNYYCSTEPLWETNCEIKFLTMNEFFNTFKANNQDKWLYFDYKHISDWFSETLKDISWNCVGFPEQLAKDSTLWIGTEGAHTPCHMDTYGCNFVAQLYGKKMWLLFHPSDTENLLPTRVPYEESSIYSNINFSCSCHQFPDIKDVRCVILEPGDVLYVPNHWWHYVENVTSAISVNTWIPVESDDESRIDESLVKCFISSMIKDVDSLEQAQILNPNERDLTEFKINQNINELNFCLKKIKKEDPKIKENISRPPLDNIVPSYSLQHVMKTIKKKCKTPTEVKLQENDNVTVKHLIDSFCHPDVIANVRKILYNKLSLKT